MKIISSVVFVIAIYMPTSQKHIMKIILR